MKSLFATLTFVFFSVLVYSQAATDGENKLPQNRQDHQIHFQQPIKEIKHIMYDKSFLPIQGEISKDKKSVVLKNWEKGTKVRVKVTYEDGTEDEIVKSPCYIDPVVL
ncbi:MAG: hypothetical protein EYC69_01215 [Bacteroidetes bacterium]|nr:MAG: hypothetical protein EYC69_01215 [Bacteroidota bacterium]